MRCPRCGPRPRSEFRKIRGGVQPAGDGRLVAIDVWVHQPAGCREWVYVVRARRILVA